MKASRETVKMKTPEGEVKMAALGDSPGTEEYLQHLNAFQQMISRKKLDDKMTKWTKAVTIAAALVRKRKRIPKEADNSGRQRKQSSRRPKPMNPLRLGWSTTSFARP